MKTIQYQNLYLDVVQFHKTWEAASFWKRTFAGGSFKKQFKELLKRNQADEEILLQSLVSAGQKWKWTFRDNNFIGKFVDKDLVKLFVFLNRVLSDEKRKDEKSKVEFFAPINMVFNTLSAKNRVSCETSGRGDKPYWSHPGIPCLLESLIQLLSAEKTKYTVVRNRWYDGPDCWKVAGSHAQKLANLAFIDLSNTPQYADLSIGKVVKDIKYRARVVCAISSDEAKKLPNYREVNGRPGGFSPMPGHCQVPMAAVLKEVDFVSELKILMIEINGLQIFQRYLGLTQLADE
jgi:hypothetical protein